MRWIPYANIVLLFVSCTVFCAGWLRKPKEGEKVERVQPETLRPGLPQNPFSRADLELGSAFELASKPPELSLPDLSIHITSLGLIERPDLQGETPSLLFQLEGEKEPQMAKLHQQIFLSYQKGHGYSVSRQKTPLSITFQEHDGGIGVRVEMVNDSGNLITQPSERALFLCRSRNLQPHHTQYQIQGHRVDPTLLVKLRARWFGKDLFFKEHGGDEYASFTGKERVEFHHSGNEGYACFVAPGDTLVWDQKRWREPILGEETSSMPLLVLQKSSENLLSFELWAPHGKGKVSMNLIRSSDPMGQCSPEREFRLLGARTLSQYTVEWKGERQLVRRGDWMVRSAKGWETLSTQEEIDAYVSGETKGPLLIIDGLTKEDGEQRLQAHLFSPSRCQMRELVITPNSSNFRPVAGGVTPKPHKLPRKPQAIHRGERS